jgi:hypothetical protein
VRDEKIRFNEKDEIKEHNKISLILIKNDLEKYKGGKINERKIYINCNTAVS